MHVFLLEKVSVDLKYEFLQTLYDQIKNVNIEDMLWQYTLIAAAMLCSLKYLKEVK